MKSKGVLFLDYVYYVVIFALLNVYYFGGFYLKFHSWDKIFIEKNVILLINTNLFWLMSIIVARFHKVTKERYLSDAFVTIIKTVALQLLLMALFIVLVAGFYYSRTHFVYTYSLFTVSLVLWHLFYVQLKQFLFSNQISFVKCIVVGANLTSGNFIKKIFDNKDLNQAYKVLGVFDDHPEADLFVKPSLIKGKIEDALQFAIDNNVEEIFYAGPTHDQKTISKLMDFCDKEVVRLKILPDLSGILNKKVSIDFYERIPILSLREEPLYNSHNRVLKRLFDIGFSSFVLIFICSWLFPLVAVLVKLSSRGPVIFRQKRTGYRNETFYCYKFRTMEMNKESHVKQAVRNDPRVTWIGKILRKTNLDELPQFINVLLGNMTIVGPRPHMLKHTDQYSQLIDNYMVRHFVKPGITGVAQIKGYRGETKTPEQMQRRVMADIWYIENWSLWLDVKIIISTVVNMIRGEKNAF